MRSDLVYCGERVDDLQNGLFVIQDPKKFCFGMDAVLLSGFARVKRGEVALDMGTGTGIIPILLSDRTDGEHFTGLEIQHECAEMADRSVRYNGLEDRVRIVEGDIREAAGIFGAASFDVVTCNPPYMIGQHGLTNPHLPKAIARHEILCSFDQPVKLTDMNDGTEKTIMAYKQIVEMMDQRGTYFTGDEVITDVRAEEILQELKQRQGGNEV